MPHVMPLAAKPLPTCNAADMVGASGGVSSSEFRDALSKLATPVSVIATDGPSGRAGLTCSAVCAVSDEPPMLLVCVHSKSAANAVIKANGVLCVNCLQVEQRGLSQAFAGIGGIPMHERFAMTDWGVLATGAPHCKKALVALDCKVADVRDMGTHTIFIAQVMATAESSEGGDPLIYQRRAYGTVRLL
ncbi:MAG TPA: flavin reductase family protein [Pseudolabrys sp.]|nr:flavin reductase family protein [Pseudolabrys sp.]